MRYGELFRISLMLFECRKKTNPYVLIGMIRKPLVIDYWEKNSHDQYDVKKSSIMSSFITEIFTIGSKAEDK